jgi:transcriptional regulator with XRE-family HTH domain
VAETDRHDEKEQLRLAARLREAREYVGISQEFVAESLSIPRAAISALESGKRKVSSLELKDLAKLYKRPVAYFLDESRPSPDETLDSTTRALFRATKNLSDEDRQQVVRFAEFLRDAGRPPAVRRR